MIVEESKQSYKLFTYYERKRRGLINTHNEKGEPFSDILHNYIDELEDEEERESINIKCIDISGKYKVAYTRTSNVFGNHGKFDRSETNAVFYENDKILFEKTVSGNTLILYGDGKTLEKTYYASRVGYYIDIYNLKNELIRQTLIGPFSQIEFRKAGPKYAFTCTIEPCSWSKTLGIVDLDLFFNRGAHSEELRPYDNSRTAFDVDYGTVPIEVKPDGFILKKYDNWDTEIPLLKWENVENYNYDDEEGEEEKKNELQTALQHLGFNIDPNVLFKMATESGQTQVSFPVETLKKLSKD